MSELIYRTRQRGTFMLGVAAIIIAIMVVLAFVLAKEDRGLLMNLVILFIPLVVVCIVFVLFSSLEIRLTAAKFTFILGPNMIKRSFPIAEIESCEPVTNNWWYGWGIRFLPNFILYNVSGRKAVELSFKNKKMKVRVGCHDPVEICTIVRGLLMN